MQAPKPEPPRSSGRLAASKLEQGAARFFPALPFVVIVIVALLAAACAGDANPPTGQTPTVVVSPAPGTTGAGTPMPSATLVFTNSAGERVELVAEIADEPEERARGLMFRESMPEDHGMVFIYDEDHLGGFYMKDTLIPLSIAFVAADGTIVDIQDMEPETLDTHRPPKPYRHAIEANQGWFERNGIAPGDRVEIPASVTG